MFVYMKACRLILYSFLLLIFFADCSNDNNGKKAAYDESAVMSEKLHLFKRKINHIIIIYQENWSFDGLYGKFPGANNLSCANTYQVEKNDSPMRRQLFIMIPDTTSARTGIWVPDQKYIHDTIYAGKPYDMSRFIASGQETQAGAAALVGVDVTTLRRALKASA